MSRLIWRTSSPAGRTSPRMRKPIIAAVAGYALGGGCELAMMCDFIIAADTREVRPARDHARRHAGHGRLAAPDPLRRQVEGDGHVLTGRMMDAAEAERCGLVSRVVPPATLMDEALKAAAKIAAFSLPAVMMAKEAVNRSYETTLAGGTALRTPAVPLAVCARGPEGRHGGLRREAAGRTSATARKPDACQTHLRLETALTRRQS